MPELPEVETVRRDLQPLVAGRRVESVEVEPGSIPLLLGDSGLEAFRAALTGRSILEIGRRGKYLLFALDDGNTFVAHLRMTGRMVWRAHESPPEPYERARIVLQGGYDLRWADLRKFGTWRIVADASEAVGKLGPEPVEDGFTLATFRTALAGRAAPIKSVLLDQRRVAGIGNIYADESLYYAGIDPRRTAVSLSAADIARLYTAVQKVLRLGIAREGASISTYIKPDGQKGDMQNAVAVFRRTGDPCYECQTPIVRIILGGRSTHFCPHCQH